MKFINFFPLLNMLLNIKKDLSLWKVKMVKFMKECQYVEQVSEFHTPILYFSILR